MEETAGKRSGAYSISVFGLPHPYVLLNYQPTTSNVFTLAHELGHAMHSYHSERAQPQEKSDYKIFVAEVASTVNEVLLVKYLLKHTDDPKVKKYLLSYYMDTLKGTLFRQTQFAEFEFMAHDMAEKGQPLTKDVLNDAYLTLNRKPAILNNGTGTAYCSAKYICQILKKFEVFFASNTTTAGYQNLSICDIYCVSYRFHNIKNLNIFIVRSESRIVLDYFSFCTLNWVNLLHNTGTNGSHLWTVVWTCNRSDCITTKCRTCHKKLIWNGLLCHVIGEITNLKYCTVSSQTGCYTCGYTRT